jgi:site-specific recombinase XerD
VITSSAQINNDHTRKAYMNATRRFAAWCDEKGIRRLADVHPFHVAAFIKHLQGEFKQPTVKQHLVRAVEEIYTTNQDA